MREARSAPLHLGHGYLVITPPNPSQVREARSLLYLTLTDAGRLLYWHLPYAQHTALLSGVLVPGSNP